MYNAAMHFEAISPKLIAWVNDEIDPFVYAKVLPMAGPHMILRYFAAEYPHNNTARRLHVAVLSHDQRKNYPHTIPGGQTHLLHIINDDELRLFESMGATIRDRFSQSPSPLFMADRIRRDETLERVYPLVVSLFFGANNKYPWDA